MVLPDFDYYAPRTLDEAVELLAQHEGAKLLAGGQTLIPLMGLGLAKPPVVVDISGLSELRYIREADGAVEIGALTTHREVEQSELVRLFALVWAEAASFIGHSHIRNRGTVGGSLAHADPAAELPVAAVLTEAQLVLVGPNGERRVGARDFFLAPLTTALGAEEILVRIEVPRMPRGAGWAFLELAERKGDFALAAAAAMVAPGPGGTVGLSRIAVGGVHPVPARIPAAEAMALGEVPGAALWARLGGVAAQEVDPESDIHATAEYRRAMTGLLVRDALALAWERGGGGGS